MKTSTRIALDAAWVAFRNGDFRLALGLLIWPPGWSHTRNANSHSEPE